MAKRRRYKVKEHQLYCVKPQVWSQLLRDNEVDKLYSKRSWRISLFSRLFYPLQKLQRLAYRKRLRSIDLNEKPPVFILGHWRSGTTHLHYALARDPQFGILTNYQNFLFNVALLNGSWMKQIVSMLMPDKRPQDNIPLDANKPAEEEQPLTMMSTRSGLHSWYFPKNQTYFNKYNLFEGITPEEKRAWQRDYVECLQNIAYMNDEKKLLLKNPHNTSRIRELLELFPHAKFITIHRDPKEVFLSTRHLYHRMVRTQFLQFISHQEIDEMITCNYQRIQAKYNREKVMIPSGNLVELSYEDLTGNPAEEIKRIYQGLELSGYDVAAPHIRSYLDSAKGFKKNRFRTLDQNLQRKIDHFVGVAEGV